MRERHPAVMSVLGSPAEGRIVRVVERGLLSSQEKHLTGRCVCGEDVGSFRDLNEVVSRGTAVLPARKPNPLLS